MNTVIFKNVECEVKISRYYDFRTKISLIEKSTGLQFANATLNIKCRINKRFVIIKDYNENEGIYEALIKSGIIKRSHRKTEVGLREAYICEMKLCRICEDNQYINNLCKNHVKQNC